MSDMRRSPTTLTALLLATAVIPPASVTAQTQAMTIQQVQSRFHGMNEVHIRKCDFNGDGLIDSKEINCVRGIYQAMYLDDR
jgi:hypothetical protein